MWNRCFQLEKLLQEGGDPWLTDSENKNSFDMAADNRSYEAYQLLNIYHAAGKLNFKPEKKTSVTPKKLTFGTPEIFTTPTCYENSQFNDDLNNSLNLTFMTAKSPQCAISPSVFSTPVNVLDPEYENLNESAVGDCTFMSAKENFPLLFSSNDESDVNDISHASEFLQKLADAKSGIQYLKANNTSDNEEEEENERGINEINIMNINGEKKPGNEKYKSSYLNKAYIFSSSSESSCTTTSDLNDSDDGSTCGTIIDSNDMSDIVLIETKNDTISLCTSNSSVCSVPNDWKSFHSIIDSDCSTLSYCSSHSKSSLVVPEDIQKYSNSKIFEELKKTGDNPGPVLDHTRHVYLHRLARLISGCAISCDLPKPSKYPCLNIYELFIIQIIPCTLLFFIC